MTMAVEIEHFPSKIGDQPRLYRNVRHVRCLQIRPIMVKALTTYLLTYSNHAISRHSYFHDAATSDTPLDRGDQSRLAPIICQNDIESVNKGYYYGGIERLDSLLTFVQIERNPKSKRRSLK